MSNKKIPIIKEKEKRRKKEKKLFPLSKSEMTIICTLIPT